MRFNVEEFAISPQEFLDSITAEWGSTSEISAKAKEPLELLGSLMMTQYNIQPKQGIGFIRKYQEPMSQILKETATKIKKKLNIEIDNLLPYLLQATIASKINGAHNFGHPNKISTCVALVVKNNLLSQPELVTDVRYAMDPEFRRMSLDIMQQVVPTHLVGRSSRFFSKSTLQSQTDLKNDAKEQAGPK